MSISKEEAIQVAKDYLRRDDVGLIWKDEMELSSVMECDGFWSISFVPPAPPGTRRIGAVRMEVDKTSKAVRCPWLEDLDEGERNASPTR